MKEEKTLDIHAHVNPDVFGHFQRLELERGAEVFRPTPIIEARKLVKAYGEQTVIPGIDFTVRDIEGKSEVISVIGPSGCGKTTILRLIAGLEKPTSGEILAKGVPVVGPDRDRGMIFQKYSSFPFLTVLENIMYPLLKVKRVKRKDAEERARHWIDKMYLNGAENKYPNQLSGGMRQRVAIARTLCMEASIILMDEPFGALDRKIRWEMQDLIAELTFLKPEVEYTVFLVTHDIPEAVYLGDRIWLIDKGRIAHEAFSERPCEPARVAQGKKPFQEMVSYFNELIDTMVIQERENGEQAVV